MTSSVRHTQLFELLTQLHRSLELGQILEAEALTAQALATFASTADSSADPRLRPLFERSQVLALQLKEKLAQALQTNASSTRAVHAYGREAGDVP